MKISATILYLAFLLLAAGCRKEETTQAAPPPVRPVKTFKVAALSQGTSREFPARIDSLQKADLAFRVPGKVKEILVTEGQAVKKGQLLARLDDTDYRIVVNDRQAAYERARKDFERARKLIEQGYISRTDYDKLEANYKSAKAALKAARQELAYTRLTAPFEGTVAKRYVEQHEEVRPNQPVLALSDTSLLKVVFDVPENVILSLRQARAREKVPVWAIFEEGDTKKKYPLKFLEAATRADPKTQTFEVTFTMEKPTEITVLPGMTVTAVVDFSQLQRQDRGILLPLTAVTANAALEPIVWVVDEQKMEVHARKVKLGELQDSRVAVLEGVAPGMRVVSAGTPYLAEGMKVRLLPQTEQAEPRPDDLKRILLTRCNQTPRCPAGDQGQAEGEAE